GGFPFLGASLSSCRNDVPPRKMAAVCPAALRGGKPRPLGGGSSALRGNRVGPSPPPTTPAALHPGRLGEFPPVRLRRRTAKSANGLMVYCVHRMYVRGKGVAPVILTGWVMVWYGCGPTLGLAHARSALLVTPKRSSGGGGMHTRSSWRACSS